jgi:hypothetical protein
VNAVPINMVLPSEGSTKKKSKRTNSNKRKNLKKVSSSYKTSLPNIEDNTVEPTNTDQEPGNTKPKSSENS